MHCYPSLATALTSAALFERVWKHVPSITHSLLKYSLSSDPRLYSPFSPLRYPIPPPEHFITQLQQITARAYLRPGIIDRVPLICPLFESTTINYSYKMASILEPGRKSTGGKAPRTKRTKGSSCGKAPLKLPVELKTSDSGPRIAASWYKNPKFSDITIFTIKYGPRGSSSFNGHRLVLSNSSQWLQTSSNSTFLEADARTITLKDDFLAALEALFQFCYLGMYTTPDKDDESLDAAKSQYLHHARVIVMADNYMAQKLVKVVCKDVGNIIDEVVFESEYASVFFKFAVETVYMHAEALGLEQTTDNDEQEVHRSSNTEANGGFEDMEVDTEDFADMDLDAVVKDAPSDQPLDRLKQAVLNTAVRIWMDNSDDIDRRHLAVLVKHIPQFGTDLAATAIGGGRLSEDIAFGHYA